MYLRTREPITVGSQVQTKERTVWGGARKSAEFEGYHLSGMNLKYSNCKKKI